MKVFDFDNTLYRGESAVDFTLFMIRRNRKIILWLPRIFWNLLRYKLCLIRLETAEKPINEFLQAIIREPEEILQTAEEFWQTHRCRLNRSLIRHISPGDAVITAGPSFLLEPIRAELNHVRLICSEVDLDKRKVVYLNFSSNKVRRYHEIFGTAPISRFFTDSYNDRAMMDISQRVYLVKKGRIRRIR